MFVFEARKRAYEKLEIKVAEEPIPGHPESKVARWLEEVLGLADESLHSLLTDLAQEGWPEPEVGFELSDDTGEIIGEAEVAWESHRLAIVMEIRSRDAFIQAEWKAFTADESLADPSLLAS